MEINIINPIELSSASKSKMFHEDCAPLTVRRQRIVSGWEKNMVELLIRFEIFYLVLQHAIHPNKWRFILKGLDIHRRSLMGQRRIRKLVKVDGKYYWGLYIPGWPSKIFHQFIQAELARLLPLQGQSNRLNNIYLAVTNKCPLACEHCYAWDELNKGEKLTLPDLQSIVRKFQDIGVSQIHLSGGEPMVRRHDVEKIVRLGKESTDFWILTSGFKLTLENALSLKEAGLTGVMISLDHFIPEEHNKFRGYKDAYDWALEAARNSTTVKLVTAFSICVTNSFITADNLLRYMQIAKQMGVSFVQILEPRATGRYRDRDVRLDQEQEHILDTFYLEMNYNDKYLDFPPVSYHGYHQRRMGCLAAGDRSLYIDTAGDIHACPFCSRKSGNAINDDLDSSIHRLQMMGCHKF